MRALLVGCGNISQTWLEAIENVPELEIVGLVDLDVARARERARQFELDIPVSERLTHMLQETQPEVVFDCTVPQAHYEVTLRALEAGCHVLGEKPLADSLPQARAMIAAAQRAGKIYAVMQNRRYDPNLRRLERLLSSGVLGDVTTINADFYIGARFGGFRDIMPHVLIKDMAIHTFDAARLLSPGDPEAVYCLEWNPQNSWYERDASAVAVFEMSGGAVFTYRGSWCAEGLRTAWESEWHIVGTKGSVRWDGAADLIAEVVDDDSGFLSTYRSLDLEPSGDVTTPIGHTGAIMSFVDALNHDQDPETVCTDNIKSLAMVLGAVESAQTRSRVLIDLS